MTEIVNGHKYRVEVKKGQKLYHALGCKGKFKLIGFYKLRSLLDGTRWDYRCSCCEISFNDGVIEA